MILELFKFLTSKASREARKNGALYESVAFESRASRLKSSWQSHWDASHMAVQEFLSKPELSSAKTLLVLASGSLFELPMDFLLQRFEKIILVDFVFPKKVRETAERAQGKIELAEANLNDLDKVTALLEAADVALSCNVLSQLHLFDQSTEAKAHQQKHLGLLKTSKKPALLWTDVQRIFRPKGQNQVVQTEDTVFASRSTPWKKWEWKIAPAPELHKDYDISLQVEAYLFNI